MTKISFLVCPLLLFLSVIQTLQAKTSNSNSTSSNVGCIETERNALIKFKKGLKDPSGLLSSWIGKDCCKWKGVVCSKQTGNVLELNLQSNNCTLRSRGNTGVHFLSPFSFAGNFSCLSGEISPSLLELKNLQHLDLSMNNFQGIPIPSFFGSLRNLNYLNLSRAAFTGMVPPQLGNLSSLRYLDLSKLSTSIDGIPRKSYVSDLHWLTGLTSLEYLDLGSVNLNQATDHWVQALNMLPSLSKLQLSNCGLENLPHSLPNLSFSSLSSLDLSMNTFNTSIPQWLVNITTLVELDLSYCEIRGLDSNVSWENFCNLRRLQFLHNEIMVKIAEVFDGLSRCSNSSLEVLGMAANHLKGPLPDSLQHMKNLRYLELFDNEITGSIPTSIGKLSNLEGLDVTYNPMNGTIPESIGNLSKLTVLELYQCSWQGVMTQNHFKGLTKLDSFSVASSNSGFIFNVSNDWIPPFSLTTLRINNCPLGPKFPAWLQTQKQLSFLVLSGVSISETIPDWLWKLSPQLDWFDLSDNQIHGELPNSLEFSQNAWVDLSFNQLEGLVPLWPNVSYLILSSNSLSGSIPVDIGQKMTLMRWLYLSKNLLTGSIPSSIGVMNFLSRLDLSKNKISGKIHDQWGKWQKLQGLDFSENNLSGEIPASLCSPPALSYLKLSRNNLSGELSSLQNCTSLSSLDLGENHFTGNIPKWIGERLQALSIIRMSGNNFKGSIPEQLCLLSHLHILDLSLNELSGLIPPCLGSLHDMSSLGSYNPQLIPNAHYTYMPNLDLSIKGRDLTYTSTLKLVNTIDLSGNNLWGEIPVQLTNLSTLGNLNLSKNHLTGKIPESIGRLQLLESLDLSSNDLSGSIPTSLSSISLSHLNLSHNNLSGPIPPNSQFLNSDPSVFEGNPQLCGNPLPTKCITPNLGSPDGQNGGDNDDDEDFDGIGFYVSIVLGFVVGFWTICGSLVLKKSWRDAYFGFIIKVKDWFVVIYLVNKNRVKRLFGRKKIGTNPSLQTGTAVDVYESWGTTMENKKQNSKKVMGKFSSY